LSDQASPSTDPDPIETPVEPSPWAKWAAVVIVGEGSLVVLVILSSFLPNVGLRMTNQPLFVGLSLALATLIAGRVAGVRGAGEWVAAAVLIITVAAALLFLLIVWIFSGGSR
jgi:hypothetical protein